MIKSLHILLLIALIVFNSCSTQQVKEKTYNGVTVTLKSPDNGDGTYTNPIIQADYSDPDAIRVGEDFYMTASSFGCAPGLPILHSKDLVNWQLITYASLEVAPFDHYNMVQHGNGIWAPAIRYHKGEFYIYYGDPDFGIFMLKAKNPEGPWSEPLLVQKAKGWIDPCPFWDEDGNAYLVHAYAGSRAGFKSVLAISRMKKDGTALLDDGVLVYDGHAEDLTVEGPKMYKKDGYYYIFAPAGGVTPGWQIVLRSKNIYGPYERKKVLHQGSTDINGPHQGAWVRLKSGEDWFIHFQDQEAYGRVVHLQPMSWESNWPQMGQKGKESGEPVWNYKKPNITVQNNIQPASMNDEFNDIPSLLWQWHANKGLDWGKSFPGNGVFRMYCQFYPDDYHNLWNVPSLFMQKIPALTFEATTKLSVQLLNDGERCGFFVMGVDYSGIEIKRSENKNIIRQFTCMDARHKSMEVYGEPCMLESDELFLKVKVEKGAVCQFFYSYDGNEFTPLGKTFQAVPGRWIGAKLGFFAQKTNKNNDSGWMDMDWFRYKLLTN